MAAAWGRLRPPSRAGALDAQRRELVDFSPVLVAAAVAGLASGLARRERVRLGSGWCSPLRAWIGKRVSLAGLFVVAAWLTTPVPADPAILWLAASALLAGPRLYAGHLPPRL